MGEYLILNQGECLSSLAEKYGLPNYRSIYDHPNNSELKRNRPNPNVLYPGDVVFIPDSDFKWSDGQTEKRHNFVLKRNKVMLCLLIKDDYEKPLANLPYKIQIDDREYKGYLDKDGKIEEEIPAAAQNALLVIFQNEDGEERALGAIPLELGHLDPVEEITGLQARLNNLGFNCGKVDGSVGRKTKEALRAFQENNNLPVTGEADSATCNALRQIHDWQ